MIKRWPSHVTATRRTRSTTSARSGRPRLKRKLSVIAYIPVSGKRCSQLTPGIEQCFVERVAVGGKLDSQSVQGNAVEHDGYEHLTLPGGQFLIDRPAQRGQQVPPFGLVRGVETEPGRQPVPVLGIPRHGRVAPKVPPDLGRHL